MKRSTKASWVVQVDTSLGAAGTEWADQYDTDDAQEAQGQMITIGAEYPHRAVRLIRRTIIEEVIA